MQLLPPEYKKSLNRAGLLSCEVPPWPEADLSCEADLGNRLRRVASLWSVGQTTASIGYPQSKVGMVQKFLLVQVV